MLRDSRDLYGSPNVTFENFTIRGDALGDSCIFQRIDDLDDGDVELIVGDE